MLWLPKISANVILSSNSKSQQKLILKARFVSYKFSVKIAVSVAGDSTQIHLGEFQVNYL